MHQHHLHHAGPSAQASALCDERELPPAGFVPLGNASNFTRLCGQLFLHEDKPILATRVTDAHLNTQGIAHGGFLSTLADCALANVVMRSMGGRLPRTAHLSIDYLGPVSAGAWLEAHVDVLKEGSRLANAACRVMVGDRLVLHATALLSMSAPRESVR